jgi:hypothetical protein
VQEEEPLAQAPERRGPELVTTRIALQDFVGEPGQRAPSPDSELRGSAVPSIERASQRHAKIGRRRGQRRMTSEFAGEGAGD